MTVIPLADSENIEKHDIGNIDLLVSNHQSKRAILYLHGFPGPYEELPIGETRFVDHLFRYVSHSFDFYYPLYTICKQSPFSFIDSLADVALVLDFLLKSKTYESVTLIGQSWGAVVALSLTARFDFSKVILVTPFLHIPYGVEGQSLVKKYSQQYPLLLQPIQLPKLMDEFDYMAKFLSPAHFLPSIDCPTSIFAAEQDEIVPLRIVHKILAHNPKARLHVLVGQSHKIEKRSELGRLIFDEID
jgi:pimeloyl-ACP methyl ester carboxylesterase